MIVLGADLSWTRSGFVWLTEKYEAVAKAQGWITGPRRLWRAATWISANMGNPDLVIIEDNAYGAPSRAVVMKLAQLNTLLKVECEARNIPWLEISPTKVKKYITGKGTAEKAQVAQELKRHYRLVFENDKGNDLSDAAALAVWGLEHGAQR